MATETASEFFQRIQFRGNPVANPKSVVVQGNARFTLLTPRLVRLEWSGAGIFEDRGTYAFPTRYAPPPPFTTRQEGDLLRIDTAALEVRYQPSAGPFSAENLSIAFDVGGERRTWTPGTPDPSNLRGTRRTLDLCQGAAALEPGLISRSGWALFDDSHSVVFDIDDGWVEARPDHERQDWVFVGHGHAYTAAITDYARFGGRIPLVPRFSLGAWWSRYWAYTEHDLRQLIQDFEAHDIPLDVLVIDMDWHTPHSWTGYTWNRDLFPDPVGFLDWAHQKGLKVTLNLHPAEGVQSFEESYPRFAEAMGVDPASEQPIPFRVTDPNFVHYYFHYLHHPLEDQGVDFWWVDWQQGETSEIPGLDPLPWINHLHFRDASRRGQRPMLFSRWGGLGNHRYPIGFSGDTFATWAALQFQPHFTATASNVLFGWWSHDIGGHMGGATPPELYARWVQFGALSPCLRLHATKDPRAERRPWAFPPHVYQAAKAAFRWRYRLLPYIYTMARVAHDTGVSLCRPIYYEYPEHEAAYVARYQYFFGDQMIAAPIVHPADPETGMASVDVWVPPGTWIDYATKERFTGPRWIRVVGDLRRVPMLVRAGAIIPLAPSFEDRPDSHLGSGTTAALPHDALVLSVFPEADGAFRLYEDDGVTLAYQEGQAEWTEIRNRMVDDETWEVAVAPVEGRCDALPDQRSYQIRLQGSQAPQSVTVNGAEIDNWSYYPDTLTTVISVPPYDKREPLTVRAVAQGRISGLGMKRDRRALHADLYRLLGNRLPRDAWGPEELRDAVLSLRGAGWGDAVARVGGPLVHVLEYVTPEEANRLLGRVVVGAPADGTSYDVAATFTLERGGRIEERKLELEALTESQLIEVPFAFDGRMETAQWTAEVAVTWRGRTRKTLHQSKLLFPMVSCWHIAFFDPEAAGLERPLDTQGEEGTALEWETYAQTVDDLQNLTQPHVIFFSRQVGHRLQVGERLAAFLRTTVHSPEARDVVAVFPPGGATTFVLNGEIVPEVPVERDVLSQFADYPLRDELRTTGVMHLRPGSNELVVRSEPPASEGVHWLFGAALIAPDGEAVTGLTFS